MLSIADERVGLLTGVKVSSISARSSGDLRRPSGRTWPPDDIRDEAKLDLIWKRY
jgi:hypothetical protein